MRRKRRLRVGPWLATAAVLAFLGWLWFGGSEPQKSKPLVAKNDSSQRLPPAGPVAQPTNSLPIVTPIRLKREPALLGATNNLALSTNSPQTVPRTDAAATNVPAGPVDAQHYPRPVQNVFEMQVALARSAISPGSIDGFLGPQTRSALRAFQLREHLAITGELDNPTRARLLLNEPSLRDYLVSSNDLTRLQPLSPTWLGKSQQTALDYENLLELISEKAQANPSLIRRLNPEVVWSNVSACTTIQIPNVDPPQTKVRAAFLTIRLADKVLQAWDADTNLLAHFPCSIARQVEKRPVGELHVTVVAPNPNYTFDPAIFPESAEAKEITSKLVLPPGPNNPVGVAWIGLDKPGYGIHGTPNPEQVGRTESHGCFRLANWNAAYLLRLVTVGTPVYVEP